MPVYRRCPRCHQLFTGPKCKRCSVKTSQKLIDKHPLKKVYSSWKWSKCRKNIVLHYQNVDIWLLGIGIYQVITGKTVVHHIIERDENPDLLYAFDNLVTVSEASHHEIHEEYKKDKKAAIARIREGIRRFEEINDN